MSRGGRRGGRGSGRRGPDLSWDDSEAPPTSAANKPAPTFPKLDLPVPKPLTASETSAVDHYLSYREKIHASPLFAILDPSSLTDDRGRVDKRAGFDPFSDQDRYNAPLLKKRRTVPDPSRGREHALQFFPKELWPFLDPKRRHPLWKTVEGGAATDKRLRKRKRPIQENAAGGGVAAVTTDPTSTIGGEQQSQAHQQLRQQQQQHYSADSDSDVLVTGRRRHNEAKTRKKDPTTKPAKQKQGLDAEDDFPEEQSEDDDVEEGERDSEFEESEDEDEGNDYNAEQYFDAGDEDEGWGLDDDVGPEERTYRD